MTINNKTSEVKAHSEFGGSQAERIMNCPGSVIRSRGIPNKSNAAADEGTDAHACLEFFVLNRAKLLESKRMRRYILEKARDKWDDDMVDHALHALNWILKQTAPKGDIFAETELDTSAFTTDNQQSTLDVSIANWSARELIIADYKYGKHPVEVKNNAQLIYYALGLLIKLKAFKKFDRIRCVIIQPRAHHKMGTIRTWVVSVDDAISWGKRFRKVVKVALKPNAPLKYGEKYCFFCLAKNKCPIMKQKQASSDFDKHDKKAITLSSSKENTMTDKKIKPAKKAAPKKAVKKASKKIPSKKKKVASKKKVS